MTLPTSTVSDTRTDVAAAFADEMSAMTERAAAQAAELEALLHSDALTPEMLLQLAQSRLAELDSQVASLMTLMDDTTAQARALGTRVMELREVMTGLEPAYDREGNLNPDAALPGVTRAETLDERLNLLVEQGRLSEDERDAILRDGRPVPAGRWGDLAMTNPRLYSACSELAGAGYLDASGAVARRSVALPVTVREYLQGRVDDGTLTEEERAAVLGGREGLQTLIDRVNDELRNVNSSNEMNMIRLQSVMQQRTSIISATTNLLKSMDEGNDAVIANLR